MSEIGDWRSDFRLPSSVLHSPSSIFRLPSSVFRLPPSAFQISRRADSIAPIAGGQCVSRVLNDGQSVFLGYLENGSHVARMSRDVDGDDGRGRTEDRGLSTEGGRKPATGRRISFVQIVDSLGEKGRRNVQGVGFHVYKEGDGIEVADDLGRSGEGVGRGDDDVPSLQADGFQGQVHGRSARIDRDSVLGPHIGGKLRLELPHLGARGDPARVQGVFDFVQFGFVDIGEGEGEVEITHR